jgi:Zn finger protein HypA/HybF involved in hydrogenase expression
MRDKWNFTIICQECGHEEKTKSKNVYRCHHCGSLDIDIDDRWDEFLESYNEGNEVIENGI